MLLHGADAFIFPSYREGLGLAAIEAMGAGLPLIVSDNRGTREYAVNGENSIVCECNNVSQFIKAVHLLSSDDELCKSSAETDIPVPINTESKIRLPKWQRSTKNTLIYQR
ncbi:MAG: glycosyltransferase [[Eubacterium] siraeum]